MRALIEAQTETLTALVELLDAETKRLTSHDIDGLDRLLADKLAALEKLERLERERQAVLRQAGFEATPAGMQAYLEDVGDPVLSRVWDALKAQLTRVQLGNEANGSVIRRSLHQLQSQLALLRGDSGGADLYGPGGGTETQSGGREISRA